MHKLMLAAVFLLTAIVPATPIATPQGDICTDVAVYFQELDTRMFEGMLAYVSDEEWQTRMERTSKIVDSSESGVLALDPEDMQPMIDIYSVPGDVLIDYPEEDIPAVAEEFHDSATRYWVVMPAMMRSVASGGVMAALVFSEDMELAETENIAALEELHTACPDLIDELTTSATDGGWDVIFDADAEEWSSRESVEAPDAFAFSLMFTPSENAEDEEEEVTDDSALATPES